MKQSLTNQKGFITKKFSPHHHHHALSTFPNDTCDRMDTNIQLRPLLTDRPCWTFFFDQHPTQLSKYFTIPHLEPSRYIYFFNSRPRADIIGSLAAQYRLLEAHRADDSPLPGKLTGILGNSNMVVATLIHSNYVFVTPGFLPEPPHPDDKKGRPVGIYCPVCNAGLKYWTPKADAWSIGCPNSQEHNTRTWRCDQFNHERTLINLGFPRPIISSFKDWGPRVSPAGVILDPPPTPAWTQEYMPFLLATCEILG
ncbi:uncharacterized protein MELLADRAFT_91704 [Melampsora larici-populina 98AG31]|uniref:Uncharacterized protein n=1 Tax=Melampsora larici-populina (strain 98AG31 / pathotype 3-4-7) TaxID=747676 RepID=F4SEK4_MELLP|nr:uncharacterized protein MELLADRAFT_91704 [Melampsora larici-populina 98AG31]EGF96922.1 hypothetical protein MELLADRAFT_91704 [Melampsora larici-populina 98AG31]